MRCKACDAEFSAYEVIWVKKLHKYEDLCRQCRRIVISSIRELEEFSINNRLLQDNTTYYEDFSEESADENMGNG